MTIALDHETATWLTIATRRVVGLFITALARSPRWRRIYVISPWISDFGIEAGLTFGQFLKRVTDDDATLYVVTRPPVEGWHTNALARIAATGKASIALLPNLHTKLYTADTAQGAIALLGSANMTRLSLENREIGVVLRGAGPGRRLVQQLTYEAADIYRTPGRRLISRRSFK